MKKGVKRAVSKGSVQKVKMEEVLLENFVSLQRVMTNLASKFDKLSKQISGLLDLFETSADALARKDFYLEKDDKENKKMLEQIGEVLDQNKIIAKGMTLIHETVSKVHEPDYETPQMQKQPAVALRPPMPPENANAIKQQSQSIPQNNSDVYQKSIASTGSKLTEPASMFAKPKLAESVE